MSNKITISNYDKQTQANNSIVINASWNSGPTAADSSGCYVTPIRDTPGGDDILYYDVATKEITHHPGTHVSGTSFWNTSATSNFYGPSGTSLNEPASTGNYNIACGVGALSSNTTGSSNTAMGYQALNKNTEGGYNVAAGAEALKGNTTGNKNIAVGTNTMMIDSGASKCVALGYEALKQNKGNQNTAVGARAMEGTAHSTSSNNNNVGIGYQAMMRVNSTSNVAVGYRAIGMINSATLATANTNTAIGFEALSYMAPGGANSNNVGIGYRAMQGGVSAAGNYPSNTGTTIGAGNVAVGSYAMTGPAIPDGSDVMGDHNIAIGSDANKLGVTGSNNIAIGHNAQPVSHAFDNTIIIDATGAGTITPAADSSCYIAPIRNAANNNALYYNATTNEITYDLSGTSGVHESGQWNYDSNLYNFSGPSGTAFQSNTTGDYNIVCGKDALTSNTTGSNNVAVGYEALSLNTKGFSNIAIGNFAGMGGSLFGASQNSSKNTAVGYSALRNMNGEFDGDVNVAVGYEALKSATRGQFNIALGGYAMGAATGGKNNIAVGYQSLGGNAPGGDKNIAVGATGPLQNNTTGTNNIAVGAGAMQNNSVGDENVAIGRQALINNVDGSNNTAIGSLVMRLSQGSNNIGVGHMAGSDFTGSSYSYNNTIIIDACGNGTVLPTEDGTCHIAPIRNAANNNALYYNATTKEITYDLSGAPWEGADAVGGARVMQPVDTAISGIQLYEGSNYVQINARSNASLTIGDGTNEATGSNSFAVGQNCKAKADHSIAMGQNCDASGEGSIVMGVNSSVDVAGGPYSGAIAIGHDCSSRGAHTIAMGRLCDASGEGSIVIGMSSKARGPPVNLAGEATAAIAMGFQCDASGQGAIAIGYDCAARNPYTPIGGPVAPAIAIGYDCSGGGAESSGGGLAIGGSCTVRGTQAVAIGFNVDAGGLGSSGCVCIGRDITTATIATTESIAINAIGGIPLAVTGDYRCYIAPIRNGTADASGYMWYDDVAKEVRYDTTAKTFIIPHPNEAGKMLRHACIEAPTRGTNIYEFQVTIAKANVSTKIALPTYFAKLNGRARVYVSAVNVFSHCYGAIDKTSTNVVIQNEKAGTFNVMVTGVRKDAGAVKYSATENIDDPILPENIPPSQTVIASGCVNANLIGSYLTKFKCGDAEKRKKAKNWGNKNTKLGQYD